MGRRDVARHLPSHRPMWGPDSQPGKEKEILRGFSDLLSKAGSSVAQLLWDYDIPRLIFSIVYTRLCDGRSRG